MRLLRPTAQAGLPLAAIALLALAAFALAPRLASFGGGLGWLAELLGLVACVGPALLGLHASSRAQPELAGSLLLTALAAAILGALYFVGLSLPTLPLQVFALLTLGRGVGGLIGDRVAHPGHVLPASVIAAAADCASVLSPEGVSNAIVRSERAISIVALAAPVFGTREVMFVLGVGDLIIIAMLLAVARKFELGRGRVALACAAGLVLAFALSALFAAPIPALVPIALAANVFVPAFARVPVKERKVAWLAMGMAAGLVVFVALRAGC